MPISIDVSHVPVYIFILNTRGILCVRVVQTFLKGTQDSLVFLFVLPHLSFCLSLSLFPSPHSLLPVDRSLFQVKEVVPQATRKEQSSTLARLLNEYDQRSANPFFEYSRFNGDVSICTDSTISWLTQFIYGGKFSLVQNFHLYT